MRYKKIVMPIREMDCSNNMKITSEINKFIKSIYIVISRYY